MNENFSDVLDQKYRLDELFALPQNGDIKALYNYLDNIAKEGGAAMPPMDFWISEMEKDLPFNESDANVRDVRKDVEEFYKANGVKAPLGRKTMEALNFVGRYENPDIPHTKEFVENFESQKFASSTPHSMTNGAYMVSAIAAVYRSGNSELGDCLVKAANALAEQSQPGHFPVREFGQYSELIVSDNLNIADKEKLVNSISQPEASEIYTSMFKQERQNGLDALENSMSDMMDKLDEKRIEEQKAGFAYSEDFSFTKEDYERLAGEDMEAFTEYVNKVKETLPKSMPEEEKETEAYKLISERQDERLSAEIEGVDKDNEFLKKFEACIKDIRELPADRKECDSLIKYDSDFMHQLKTSEKLGLKFKWMAGNVKEEAVRMKDVSPLMNKIQKIHCASLTAKMDETVQTIARCNEKITDLQLSAKEKEIGHLGTFAIDMKIKGLELIQKAHARKYSSMVEKKNLLNRKIEKSDRAINDYRIQTEVSDLKYLKQTEFNKFTESEKKLLHDFSMAAHKSFTVEEANMMLGAYIASDGRFNPNMLAKYEGKDLSEAILSANRVALEDQTAVTHEELMQTNRMDFTLTDHAAEILGSEKLAMGITAAQKRFIVEEYDTGAKVEDLQAIAGQFYSKSGFSVEDARVHMITCRFEDKSADEAYKQAMNGTLSVPDKDPLSLMANAAKTMNKTLMTSFQDYDTNTMYQLKAAKNGRQFTLKKKNLETGEIELFRGTQTIRDELARNTDYGIAITNSTRECVANAFYEQRTQPVETVEKAKAACNKIAETAKEGYSSAYDKAAEVAGKPKQIVEDAVKRVKKKIRDTAESIEI